MEEANKENTTTEVVSEVKAEQPVPEAAQETKVENETKTDNQTNGTSTAADASATNSNNTSPTQENNSTISPLYSRWRTFSFSKVIENVKKQSETVKGVYQKDLSEFVNTITTESQNLKQKINNMTKKADNGEVDAISPDAASPNESPKDDEKPKEPERTALYIKRNNNLINKMSTGITSLLNKNKQEVPKKKKIFDKGSFNI